MDLEIYLDLAFVMYLFLAVVTIIGAGLFTYFWIRKGKATPMYVYVTIGLYGTAWLFCTNVYTRHLTLTQEYSYLHEWWWPLRLVVAAAAAACIVGLMAWRMWKTRGR